jgi:hypothetical protein
MPWGLIEIRNMYVCNMYACPLDSLVRRALDSEGTTCSMRECMNFRMYCKMKMNNEKALSVALLGFIENLQVP